MTCAQAVDRVVASLTLPDDPDPHAIVRAIMAAGWQLSRTTGVTSQSAPRSILAAEQVRLPKLPEF